MLEIGKDKSLTAFSSSPARQALNCQGLARVVDRPLQPARGLDSLLMALDIDVAAFVQCQVSKGSRLSLTASDLPSVHFCFAGNGRMSVGDRASISLSANKLVLAPAGHLISFDDGHIDGHGRSALNNVVVASRELPSYAQTVVAGGEEPLITVVVGYFRTTYASSIDLFATLTTPIVEDIEDGHPMTHSFRSILDELVNNKMGMKAMTTALLKMVLVMILRGFLSAPNSQLEQLVMLNDPRIARAFADMAAEPGSSHTVYSLSVAAGMSRSVFMVRFARAFGATPMAVLRQLRMRRAAALLAKGVLSIEQVAHAVGYESRSSFIRAFREAYGTDPSIYARQLSHCGR